MNSRVTTSEVGPLPRRLGLLALAFYVVHALNLWRQGLLPHAAWSCHVSCLLLFLGITLRSARLVSVALLWLCLGLPAWLGSAIGRNDFHWTSTLTHVGGLVLAFVAARRMGVPRGVWWQSSLGLIALWATSRLTLSATENVNVSHGFWFGFEERYVSYPVYLALLLAAATLTAYAVERGMRRLCA